MKELKVLSLLVAVVIAIIFSYLLIASDLLRIGGWLSWTLGCGVVGVLYLHGKSFFMSVSDDLGKFYSRMYGFYFGLIYTSFVFLIFVSILGQEKSQTTNFIFLITVYATAIFNFLRDNYADLVNKHFIAKNLMEQNNKSDN